MPPQAGIENATHEQVRGTEMEMRVNEEESEVGAPREVGLIQLRVCASEILQTNEITKKYNIFFIVIFLVFINK